MVENNPGAEAPKLTGGNDNSPSDPGRSRFGNRGRRRNNRGHQNNNTGPRRHKGTTSNFEGHDPAGLKGSIYDYTTS